MNPSNLLERWLLVQAINADAELTATDKVVASALMGFVNSRTGDCFPSHDALVASCHVSRRGVVTSVGRLEQRGWVEIDRTDGNSNRYHFAFDRIRAATAEVKQPQPSTPTVVAPGSAKFALPPVQTLRGEGRNSYASPRAKFAPKLEEEENLARRTQESLLGEGQSPQAPPFDFESWFNSQWWPQYPAGRRVEKAEAKKWAKAIIEGRRRDGVKATPDELLAGVMRYAAEMTGTDPQYIKHPTTWLKKGCWADEHPERAGRRGAASEEVVWAAGERMAARSKKAAG